MGSILKGIESVLQSCGVQRQAYHSCSFVGNHVHKMLKFDNIKKLCDSIPQTVFNNIKDQEHPIYMEAVDIQQKFKILFHNYSKCDNDMNSCHLFNEENIKSFETTVCELMKFFRNTWPNESITPKMHMLENHMGVFLSTWGVGLRLYGEQGGESIHPEFNKYWENILKHVWYAKTRMYNERSFYKK